MHYGNFGPQGTGAFGFSPNYRYRWDIVLMSQRLFSSLAGLVKALVDLVAMDLKATTPTSFLELQLGAILLLPSLLHSALLWVMAYSDPSSLRQ